MAVYKTAARERLLSFFETHKGACFTVKDILAEMLDENGKTPSESTTYRLLSDLVKNGIVERSVAQENREYTYRYAENGSSKVNMRCRVCGQVYNVSDDAEKTIKSEIAKLGEVNPEGEIEFLIKCRKCKK